MTLGIAENLSSEHNFLMFRRQTLDADGNTIYEPYNRFPIGGYALIKLATLPFGDDLSAKIYAARTLMLMCFAAAAALAYLSLRRIIASRWIALAATLLAFSSAYCLYYGDVIFNEVMIDIFAVLLVFHGMAIFEQNGRFPQLPIKACIALFLGWHVYALLLPFIVFGLMRELIKTFSGVSTHRLASQQLKHAARALMRSRYLTLGVVALLFGISVLTFNFTNEYFALNRETPFTETPSFRSLTNRTGVDITANYNEWVSWPAFPKRQFYRIGVMSLPYLFSSSYDLEHRSLYNSTDALPRLFVILGITASGASLIGLLFVRRHKILLTALALSGFCWAFPMRYNTALPWHDTEAVYYIGVALTLFSLVFLGLRRLSSHRIIAALSVGAALIFVLSVLRMSHLDNPNEMAELYEATITDFEIIRNMTDNEIVIQTNFLSRVHTKMRFLTFYYLAGRITMYRNETARSARAPDFVVTDTRLDGLAPLTPQNQMIFLYGWNAYHRHIDEFIEQTDAPLIRSVFDVHLIGNGLIYAKDDCSEDDITEKFFLALHPTDGSDLPSWRRQYGFDNRDFRFEDQAVRRGERCIAIAPLPDYDIARIHTGQFIQRADGSYEHTWEGDVRLTEMSH